MFCYQCQESKGNTGCDISGVCGKSSETANLQDLLIYVAKGVSFCVQKTKPTGIDSKDADIFVMNALFMTITNTNFDNKRFVAEIMRGVEVRQGLKTAAKRASGNCSDCSCVLPDEASCFFDNEKMIYEKSKTVSILNEKDEDIRSLTELLIYGLKGVAAYAHHAHILGYDDKSFYEFMNRALAYTISEDKKADELLALTLECGKKAVDILALLDKANTEKFGMQSPTYVNRGRRSGKAVLVSGHDLLDLYELLEATTDKGIDIYTHGEMLPAHAYPKLKAFGHLVGNFGTSWHNQQSEFESFPGAILFTTNCIQKPRDSYKSRVFTTGTAGFEGVNHIADRASGGKKDFTALIDATLKSESLSASEGGVYTIGFAKDTLVGAADKIIEAVKSGIITKFVVMAGCDGRHKERAYFTDIAKALPKSAVILTAGCAKYRYNDLELGDIAGIPRLIDAGQCNDSYSLAYIALKLKEAFELDDINNLPIAFDIAWYEQKAIAVLLALLHLGFKNIRIGTTLPAFLSPNVAKILINTFGLQKTTDVHSDIAEMAI